MILLCIVAGLVLAACSGSNTQKAHVGALVADIDLTTAGATGSDGGVLYEQSAFDSSTGTGVFESFVRIQKDGSEKGHNTDANPVNDEKTGTFTRSLKLSDIPTVVRGGVTYREFRLDINQVSNAGLLSLDVLRVTCAASGNLTSNSGSGLGNLVYEKGNFAVLLNYNLAPGSGNGDMLLLIPDSMFTTPCAGANQYVYFWSEFGKKGGAYQSNDGFEEWSVRKKTVGVAKTALTELTQTHTWTINKSVTPNTWNLFKGDTGTSQYTVAVDKTTSEGGYKVSGQVIIANPTSDVVRISSISDVINPGNITPTLSCSVDGTTVNPSNYRLAAGKTMVCTYSADLPDKTARTNTVTVTIGQGASQTELTATAPVDFSNPKVNTVGPTSVTVEDPNGNGGNVSGTPTKNTFSDDGTWVYNKTFSCNADAGKKDNTAKILETNQTASASVQVNCYDLTVTKTAATEIGKERRWKIEKSANPSSVNLFQGDSSTVGYTVSVTKEVVDTSWKVSGTITISNPAPMSAPLTGVSDVVSPGINATVDCGGKTSVPAKSGDTNGSIQCTYMASLPDASDRTNTATATLQNKNYDKDGNATNSGTTGFSGTANVSFANATITTSGPESVDVSDSLQGVLQNGLSESKTFTYNRSVDCSDVNYNGNVGSKTIPNTASLSTGATANASVTVNCYRLGVSKTANPTFTRKYNWNIAKVGRAPAGSINPAAGSYVTSLTLATGQVFTVDYTVTLSNSAPTDSAWAVSGTITISNPAPMPATLTGVSDTISGVGSATVACPALSVPAGGSLQCTYSANLPDAGARTNTATATLQNTPSGTTSFSGTANITFGGPTTEVDKCVTVTDDKYGSLGTVCADSTNKTFSYSMDVGPYQVCGLYEFRNTATFTTNTTQTTGNSSWTISVNVPCPGCTLTQGYWKTHSRYGPVPAKKQDDAWNLVMPSGPDSPFFLLAPTTWYQVFWTAPQGNVYYNLAHQYMAARLNILNQASSTAAVNEAITWAEQFFNQYLPTSTLSNALRNQARNYATTLDNYNNGLIGPGHCSE
jgi:hypothetical protein